MKKTFYDIFRQKKTKEIKIPYRLNWCSAYLDCIQEKVITSVIDKYMTFTYAPNRSEKVAIYSVELDALYTTSLREYITRQYNWRDYINGCIAELAQRGYKIKVGVNIYVDNDLPSGMGLASSACFLIGILKVLLEVNGFKYNSNDEYNSYDDGLLVGAAYSVEHDFLRIPCGLMDFKAVLHTTGIWLIDTSVAFLEVDELVTDRRFTIVLLKNNNTYTHTHLNNLTFKTNVAQLQAYLTYKDKLENPRIKYMFPVIHYCETQRQEIKNLIELFKNWDRAKYPSIICDVILNTSNEALNQFLGSDRFTDIQGVQALGSGIGGYGFKVLDRENAQPIGNYSITYCRTL